MQAFKTSVDGVAEKFDEPKKRAKKTTENEGAVAKILEEMKLMMRELPIKIERNMMVGMEYRPPKPRRFHSMMVDEMARVISQGSDDLIGILIIASLVRDDFPWLYEIGLEAYRSSKTGDGREVMRALEVFRNAVNFTMRGPFMDELGLGSKEAHMMMREISVMIDHCVERLGGPVRRRPIRRRIKKVDESESS